MADGSIVIDATNLVVSVTAAACGGIAAYLAWLTYQQQLRSGEPTLIVSAEPSSNIGYYRLTVQAPNLAAGRWFVCVEARRATFSLFSPAAPEPPEDMRKISQPLTLFPGEPFGTFWMRVAAHVRSPRDVGRVKLWVSEDLAEKGLSRSLRVRYQNLGNPH